VHTVALSVSWETVPQAHFQSRRARMRTPWRLLTLITSSGARAPEPLPPIPGRHDGDQRTGHLGVAGPVCDGRQC